MLINDSMAPSAQYCKIFNHLSSTIANISSASGKLTVIVILGFSNLRSVGRQRANFKR